MAAHIIPPYLPRRRGWQMALGEAGVMMLTLSAALLYRFGHDAPLVLRDDAGWRIGLVCALCLLCLYGFDLYECPVLGDWRELWLRLPLALGVLALWMAGLLWMFPALDGNSRWAVPVLAAVAFTVIGVRSGWWFGVRRLRRREPALVLGAGELADVLYGELCRHGELGWPLAGRLSTPRREDLLALVRDAERPWARWLLAAFPGGWEGVTATVRQQLEAAGCRLEDGAEWYERLSGKVAIPARAFVCAPAPAARAVLAHKRLLDAVVAAAALVVAVPLLLLVAALVRMDSPGPVIFRQRRVGRGGQEFTLYKFRTMFVNSGNAALPAGLHDPRCTRVGRWLRRLRLDELPQLINILRGEMSLVGPRPFIPEQEAECCGALPGYEQRWSVLPGVTGWAQVNRGYCATLDDNREKLAYDLFYIKHLSLGLDVIILLQTLKVVCLGRGGR
ncbi:MAG: exopolysaccharide biosynthesis polyprenyl glycosylphosphotransferase [Terriglobales bacterium]